LLHFAQEIVYQLLQGNDVSGSSRTHSYPSSSCGHQRTSGEPKLRGAANYESQLAVDEALARELQEIEDQISNTSIGGNILKEGD
jgi:E3 ubiquitin-protein ligase BIG BROTHER-like protein